jgi:nucleotidyltransferase substrate binding protein (TIGR01987 family)
MTSNPDIRWRQRFQSFGLAFAQLTAAADLAAQRKLTDLEQQGLIQAFEFTHELAWKTLKDFLEAHGVTTQLYGSKDATREAFAQALITDGDEWMAMIAARNATNHTYNQRTAREIATAILTGFMPCLSEFQNKFRQLEAEVA